jgi:hypothetical protein
MGGSFNHCLARIWMNEAQYDGPDLVIGKFLETVEIPNRITDPEFVKFGGKLSDFLYTMDICSNEVDDAEIL